jgi:hypothetical protein
MKILINIILKGAANVRTEQKNKFLNFLFLNIITAKKIKLKKDSHIKHSKKNGDRTIVPSIDHFPIAN